MKKFIILPILAIATLSAALFVMSACKTVKSTATVDELALKSATVFSYADWSNVLTTYVDDKGEVNYPALKQNRASLDTFVATIAKVGPKMRPDLFPSNNARLAYYINAYNALTMFNVINRYPDIGTVTDDQLSFFVTTKFPLDGGEISLYDLENKVVRPTFNDPRVHFALNCASASCPVLPNEIFDPEKLDAQLDRETQKFLHEPRNVTVEGESVTLSEILKWYKEDFKPTPLQWIKTTAPDLNVGVDQKVQYRPYDWALNDSTRP